MPQETEKQSPPVAAALSSQDVYAILEKAGFKGNVLGETLGGLMMEFIGRLERTEGRVESAEGDLRKAKAAFVRVHKRVEKLEQVAAAAVAPAAPAGNGVQAEAQPEVPTQAASAPPPADAPDESPSVGMAGAFAGNAAVAAALAREEAE